MMSRLGNVGGRLYRGDVSVNFVGRQRTWYTISGIILAVSAFALIFRGLNFSIDFKGGAVFSFKAPNATTGAISRAVTAGGGGDSIVRHVGSGGDAMWQAQTSKLSGSAAQLAAVQDHIASALGINSSQITTQYVGPTWGSQISGKAIQALIVFLILIVAYLTIAFEWKMAVSAFVALLHDIVITTGVYALTGFQVAPATIIGLLTILGYSLYDTVVVFDKVRENTAGILTTQRSTYSQAANLALNQTLVRSINTSLIALLPVASILFIGVGFLGAGTLKDLSLVLFVGMLSGAYSSIFIATPVLADLKEREPRYKALAKRVATREAGGRAARRAAARTPVGAGGGSGTDSGAGRLRTGDAGSVADDMGPVDDVTDTVEDDVTDTEETAPVAQGAGRQAPEGPRQYSRQQPRRTSASQRRPTSGNRKKRR
jgi:preprotein translocase subunit SecF